MCIGDSLVEHGLVYAVPRFRVSKTSMLTSQILVCAAQIVAIVSVLGSFHLVPTTSQVTYYRAG